MADYQPAATLSQAVPRAAFRNYSPALVTIKTSMEGLPTCRSPRRRQTRPRTSTTWPWPCKLSSATAARCSTCPACLRATPEVRRERSIRASRHPALQQRLTLLLRRDSLEHSSTGSKSQSRSHLLARLTSTTLRIFRLGRCSASQAQVVAHRRSSLTVRGAPLCRTQPHR